jgi:DHA2 family multidrug resistance protein
MVGPTLGPTLGGWITDNYAWPWIFYINVPLGLMAGMMTWRYVPEPAHHIEMPDHVDWKGLVLLILGIGALQIFLERGEKNDWFASRETVMEMTVAVIALLLFVWHELRTRFPVVNLRVLKNKQLTVGVVFGLLLGFALYSSVFALPVFLQNLLGYTAWDTGLVILPGAIASAVTMAVAGRFNTKIDARLSITVGVLLFAAAMWMHYHFTLELGMGDTVIPMILRGAAMGLIFVPLTAATIADLPSSQMAQGTGLFNLSRQVGGSFGIAITATLLARWTERARDGLRPHLGVTDLRPRQWLAGAQHLYLRQGGTPQEAMHKAQASLAGIVHQQASVIAFEKVFLTMGVAFLLVLPLLLFMKTGKVGGKPGPAH